MVLNSFCGLFIIVILFLIFFRIVGLKIID